MANDMLEPGPNELWSLLSRRVRFDERQHANKRDDHHRNIYTQSENALELAALGIERELKGK